MVPVWSDPIWQVLAGLAVLLVIIYFLNWMLERK